MLYWLLKLELYVVQVWILGVCVRWTSIMKLTSVGFNRRKVDKYLHNFVWYLFSYLDKLARLVDEEWVKCLSEYCILYCLLTGYLTVWKLVLLYSL
jgi:hypothetical protein